MESESGVITNKSNDGDDALIGTLLLKHGSRLIM